MAPVSLSTERRAGGLQGPARDLNAALWRAPLWFICPLVRNDGGPPRRVAKLYPPSGGKYLGRREGYSLTYTSCQESGKNGSLWRAPSDAPQPQKTRHCRGLVAGFSPWSRPWSGIFRRGFCRRDTCRRDTCQLGRSEQPAEDEACRQQLLIPPVPASDSAREDAAGTTNVCAAAVAKVSSTIRCGQKNNADHVGKAGTPVRQQQCLSDSPTR
jgi:hypothetical protein